MDNNIIDITNIIDTISISIFPLMYFPLIVYILTRKIEYLYIFIGVLIVRTSTELVRELFAKMSKNPFLYRPEGCSNCSLTNTPTDPNGPAFPSGHMGLTTFLVITLLYVTKNTNMLAYVLTGIYILLMGYSRYYKKCHNIPQIIAGILHGSIWAFVFIKFNSKT